MEGLYGVQRKRKKKKKGDDSNKEKEGPKSAAIRMATDFATLDLPNYMTIVHEKPINMLKFTVLIEPNSGLWKGARYNFKFAVPQNYPHKAPKVTLVEKIYHPNIDYDGNICLNVLKKDWRPILSLEQVLHGLNFLFLEPNPKDPLNEQAAKVFREDRNRFEKNVKKTLRGESLNAVNFPRFTS